MMKNLVYRLGLSLMVLGLFGAGCASSVSSDDTHEVTAFLQDMADARDHAMLSGDVTAYATYFDSAWPSADPQMNEYDPEILRGMRERLVAQGTDLVELTSNVTVSNIERVGITSVIHFTIDGSMSISVGGHNIGEPSLSRGDFRAVLRPEGDRYVITSFGLDRGGESSAIPFEGPRPTDLDILPTASGTTIDLEASVPLTYYYSAAAAYSDRWATSRNLAYFNFASLLPGGDCTNFVSQCLSAGGRGYIAGSQSDARSWWYSNSATCATNCWSYSWAGASNLWSNLLAVPSGASIGSVAYVRSGDLIFADWNRAPRPLDGVMDHAMIVSQRICSGDSWSCVQINQHTNDRYRQAMSVTIALSEAGSRFYTVRPTF